MKEIIQKKLEEIEKQEHVKIILAVESGSRAWGFESTDSDYDVRFIYVREPEMYLRLDTIRDVIEWQLDEVFDICGWDIKKALQLLYKSNPTLFEWIHSPIVYKETEEAIETPIRVMIVDDHEIVRRGIAEIVDRADDLEVVAEAGTVQDALRRAQLVSPDVILVDLQLPDGTGIDIMESLGQTNPEIRPIVLTSFDDDEALAESLAKGARAYVLKTVRGAEITDVIKAVAEGRILLDERTLTRRRADHDDPTADLTPSERKVLELIGDGLSNREIGAKLGVAEKTVKNHITSLLSKMGLQRRTQVAAWVAGQRAAAWRN